MTVNSKSNFLFWGFCLVFVSIFDFQLFSSSFVFQLISMHATQTVKFYSSDTASFFGYRQCSASIKVSKLYELQYSHYDVLYILERTAASMIDFNVNMFFHC